MILKVLSFFHQKKYWLLLNLFSRLMYFLKGHGFVKATFHPAYRAYEYKVNGVVFMTMGPGWAFHTHYLRKLLEKTYNHFYIPAAGDCVVDIGAGLGEETVIYAMLVGARGKVLALEANPVTFGGLRYMAERNNFQWVTALNAAIYKSDGEVTIEDDPDNYLTNTINSAAPTGKTFSVKAQTLDSLVKQHSISRIDFLKSNIEGAEQYLIEGMHESVKMVRNICISCHDFRHRYHNHGEFYLTKRKVKSYLEANGFKVIVRNTGDRVVDDYVYGFNAGVT